MDNDIQYCVLMDKVSFLFIKVNIGFFVAGKYLIYLNEKLFNNSLKKEKDFN